MYKVNVDGEEKYLVQLVGPNSYYLMGGQRVMRGGTLTVTKRTRDYLVRKTNGAWRDFDPTPDEPIEELFPPQFGEQGGPEIDMDDLDPEKNPAMTMDHARQLAARSGEASGPGGIDPGDLSAPAGKPDSASAEGSGDMTSADLKGSQKAGSGGQTASKPKGTTFSSKPKTTAQKAGNTEAVDIE